MAEHDIFHQILDELKQADCWYESFEHGVTVRTSEQAAALRPNYTLSEAAKALIVRLKIPHQGKLFVMAVLPGDKKFDSKKLKQAAGASDLRFATETEVYELTSGVKPGGVPPFGNLFGIAAYADKGVFSNQKIIFNAGRDVPIAMLSADYMRLVKPVVAEIV